MPLVLVLLQQNINKWLLTQKVKVLKENPIYSATYGGPEVSQHISN